jgi:hypothetical protein
MAFGGGDQGRVLVVALAFSLASCSSNKRAPFIDSSPTAGQKLNPTGDGSAGAGDGSAGAGDGTSPDPTPPTGGIGAVGGGDLGSTEVALYGTLGSGYLALAAVSSPNSYVVGFNHLWSSLAFQGSSLLYLNESRLYQFVEDGAFTQRLQDITYPDAPEGNDILIDTPQCGDTNLVSFIITSSGRLVYGCSTGKTTTYYDGNDAVLASDDVALLAVGAKNLGLAASSAGLVTVSLASPTDLHPVTDVVLPPLAYRANKDGFYVAESGATIKLFQVSADGSSQDLGTYPPEPDGIYPYQSQQDVALTKDGTLYEIGNRMSNDLMVILRRTIGGKSEIVYDEADDPHVEIVNLGSLIATQ